MRVYPFPNGYEKSQTIFTITCDGAPLQAYSCDVSAIPFNQVWEGKQRSIEQTKKACFVSFGKDGETVLEIQAQIPITGVSVRPLSKNIPFTIENGVVKVRFPSVGQYVLEFDGIIETLAVFINPEKDFSACKTIPNMLYFAPGVHYVEERIPLEDGQTVFIDEGAVVYGALCAVDKKDIRIVGYGILDNSRMRRQDALQTNPLEDEDKTLGLPIQMNRCTDVLVEGVTIVNSSEWTMKFTGCKNVTVDNIKIIGLWRYNADGCDFCNCQNATIRNSFIRAFDDCIVVKGFYTNREMPVENVLAENCVIWCDWGRCLEIGAETCAPYMRNIVFRDCYLIYGCDVMMDVQQGDGAPVSNVLFENIKIEYTGKEQKPALEMFGVTEYTHYGEKHTPLLFTVVSGLTMWSHDEKTGGIDGVTFRNIQILSHDGKIPQGSYIGTREENSQISNIVLDNITVNGKPCGLQDLGLVMQGNVQNVKEL